jgi:cell wall-associated NlpC family hydrolase
MRRAYSHVGIYLGDNLFIHSPRPGKKVRVERMTDRYWAQRFNGARRVLNDGQGTDPSQRP